MPEPVEPSPSLSNVAVSLSIEDPVWRDADLEIPLEDFIEAHVRTVLYTIEIPVLEKAEMVDVSVVLMNDAMIQSINHEYRGKNKPTNVLSFPQLTVEEIKSRDLNINEFLPLGDILISYETIVQEAKEQEKDFDAHFAHMIIHGMLHLLGYDHLEDDEAEEMEHVETLIMTGLGYKAPYEGMENA